MTPAASAKEYGKAIVSTLSAQLPWSAFLGVLPIDDALGREFYVTMAATERWSVRELRDQMDGMLYERTLISRKPEKSILKTQLQKQIEQAKLWIENKKMKTTNNQISSRLRRFIHTFVHKLRVMPLYQSPPCYTTCGTKKADCVYVAEND